MVSSKQMGWYPVAQREMKELLAFLRTREWTCVSFTSRIVNREGGGNRVFLNRAGGGDNRIVESLLLTAHGLVLPVIEPTVYPAEQYRDELLPLLWTSTRTIHSVMGLDEQVAAMESVLASRIHERIEYYLMTREYFNIEPPIYDTASLTIRRATAHDVRSLFPLQRDYEKEEVLLNPEKFNSTASFLTLQKNLRKEVIFVAELDGVPVAKAGTNARGMNYFQVGGVFTVPSLRGQGIGKLIMKALMWEVAQRKKHLCLFVKRSNPAAIQLYTSLGFTLRDKYAISYYRT